MPGVRSGSSIDFGPQIASLRADSCFVRGTTWLGLNELSRSSLKLSSDSLSILDSYLVRA